MRFGCFKYPENAKNAIDNYDYIDDHIPIKYEATTMGTSGNNKKEFILEFEMTFRAKFFGWAFFVLKRSMILNYDSYILVLNVLFETSDF